MFHILWDDWCKTVLLTLPADTAEIQILQKCLKCVKGRPYVMHHGVCNSNNNGVILSLGTRDRHFAATICASGWIYMASRVRRDL